MNFSWQSFWKWNWKKKNLSFQNSFNYSGNLHVVSVTNFHSTFNSPANAAESDKRDLMKELETMKQLKPHPYVIKLLGCVTESGMLCLWRFNFAVRIFLTINSVRLVDGFSFLGHFFCVGPFKYKNSVSLVDCTDFVFFSGITKRNRASRDNACDWTSQLVRSVGRALHRYRKGHEFKSRTGLNVFFRPSFHYCSSSVYFCEYLFHIHVQGLSLTDRLWLFYTLLRDRS